MTAPILPLTVPDVVAWDDLDSSAAETTSDLESLSQDVYHILIETRGSNIDDVTRGIGIEGLLSGTQDDLIGKAQAIETQLLEDDRIDACTVTVSVVGPGYVFQLSDGTSITFDGGGFLIEIDIQADATVVGLTYGFSPTTGLVSA